MCKVSYGAMDNSAVALSVAVAVALQMRYTCLLISTPGCHTAAPNWHACISLSTGAQGRSSQVWALQACMVGVVTLKRGVHLQVPEQLATSFIRNKPVGEADFGILVLVHVLVCLANHAYLKQPPARLCWCGTTPAVTVHALQCVYADCTTAPHIVFYCVLQVLQQGAPAAGLP